MNKSLKQDNARKVREYYNDNIRLSETTLPVVEEISILTLCWLHLQLEHFRPLH